MKLQIHQRCSILTHVKLPLPLTRLFVIIMTDGLCQLCEWKSSTLSRALLEQCSPADAWDNNLLLCIQKQTFRAKMGYSEGLLYVLTEVLRLCKLTFISVSWNFSISWKGTAIDDELATMGMRQFADPSPISSKETRQIKKGRQSEPLNFRDWNCPTRDVDDTWRSI